MANFTIILFFLRLFCSLEDFFLIFCTNILELGASAFLIRFYVVITINKVFCTTLFDHSGPMFCQYSQQSRDLAPNQLFFDCSQTKIVALILVMWVFFAIFHLTDFSFDPFDFSSSKTGYR